MTSLQTRQTGIVGCHQNESWQNGGWCIPTSNFTTSPGTNYLRALTCRPVVWGSVTLVILQSSCIINVIMLLPHKQLANSMVLLRHKQTWVLHFFKLYHCCTVSWHLTVHFSLYSFLFSCLTSKTLFCIFRRVPWFNFQLPHWLKAQQSRSWDCQSWCWYGQPPYCQTCGWDQAGGWCFRQSSLRCWCCLYCSRSPNCPVLRPRECATPCPWGVPVRSPTLSVSPSQGNLVHSLNCLQKKNMIQLSPIARKVLQQSLLWNCSQSFEMFRCFPIPGHPAVSPSCCSGTWALLGRRRRRGGSSVLRAWVRHTRPVLLNVLWETLPVCRSKLAFIWDNFLIHLDLLNLQTCTMNNC